jgi:hypothetical protein
VMGGHARGAPTITDYPDESDIVPVPFPATSLGDPYNAYPEGNFTSGDCSNDGDCHIEITDVENWVNWSMWRCFRNGTGPFAWDVANIAQYPFHSEVFTRTGTGPIPGGSPSPVGGYRPIGWTSGDAAGLAITPGLVLLDEIAEGEIQHALRSCSVGSANYYVHPASHRAGSLTGAYDAPMGLRWRLKSSFDINQRIPLTGTPGTAAYRDARAARIILRACQKYGMINADNSSWSSGYFMAEMDDHQELKWDSLCASNSVTRYIASVGISWDDFEVVRELRGEEVGAGLACRRCAAVTSGGQADPGRRATKVPCAPAPSDAHRELDARTQAPDRRITGNSNVLARPDPTMGPGCTPVDHLVDFRRKMQYR